MEGEEEEGGGFKSLWATKEVETAICTLRGDKKNGKLAD